jgi:hypothetical protein
MPVRRRILDRVSTFPSDGIASELRLRLGTAIELVREVSDDDRSWETPLKDSQAGGELLAEESRQAAPQTGSWPWLMAPMVARWALWVAVEEAKAFRDVLDTETTSYGADVLCRSVLESSSLAWWLLDPAIDAEGRLARALVYRYHTARQTEKAAQHLEPGPMEDRSEYGELPDSVEQEARELGFEIDPKRISCRGQSLPNYTERVADLIQQVWPQHKLPYALLSAVGHAELVGLTRNLAQLPTIATRSRAATVTTLRPMPDRAGLWFWHDTYLVSGALLFSGERAATFLGREQHATSLRAGMTDVQHALKSVRPIPYDVG